VYAAAVAIPGKRSPYHGRIADRRGKVRVNGKRAANFQPSVCYRRYQRSSPSGAPPVHLRTAKEADMELNRNQFFLAGLVVLFLGIQFRMLGSVTLNDKTTRFLASRMQDKSAPPLAALAGQNSSLAKKIIHPPQWLGYALLSIGSVLVLHSLAMPKPGGGG
jgi:hypothetical protein